MSGADARRVAMIAGSGALPRAIANALGRARVPWSACHLQGHVPQGVGQSRGFRIERFGGLLADLRGAGVTDVVLAGAIARPTIDPSLVDEATAPLVPRIAAAVGAGDDAALRAIVAIIEDAGMRVASVADVAPELVDLPLAGEPSEGDRADIARGRAVLEALGPVDVGQACVVAAGQVLAIEALPGTDWMLASLAPQAPQPPVPRPPVPRAPGARMGDAARGGVFGGISDWLTGPGIARGLPSFPRPDGGVLVKMPKPGQDLRVDMPAIGPDTVRRASAAGLSGIAVARGGVIALERGEMADVLRGTSLFLHAFDA